MKEKMIKCRGCEDDAPMMRGRGSNSKFSTVVRLVENLGPQLRGFSPSGFIFTRDVSLRTGLPPSSRVVSISVSSSCRVNYT